MKNKWNKCKCCDKDRIDSGIWGTSIGILVDNLFSFFQTRIHESVSAVSTIGRILNAFLPVYSISSFVGGEFNGAWGLFGCCWEENLDPHPRGIAFGFHGAGITQITRIKNNRMLE